MASNAAEYVAPNKDWLLAAAQAEHGVLAAELRDLTDEQWTSQSLCPGWSVEDVVAHLTAGVTTGTLRWIRSVVGARFDFDLHNERLIAAHRGPEASSTLARYCRSGNDAKSTWGPKAAWLGEVVVHGNDIRRAIGLTSTTSVERVTPVAYFFARTNFTVASKNAARGLRLQATDGPFASGDGPQVGGRRSHSSWQWPGAACSATTSPGPVWTC